MTKTPASEIRRNAAGHAATTGRAEDFAKMSYDEFRRRFAAKPGEERWVAVGTIVTWVALFAGVAVMVALIGQ